MAAKTKTYTAPVLLAFFALYLGLSLYRQSDGFAWGAVALVWLGGLLMMRLLHSLGQTALGEVPGFVVLLSFFFYLSVRISQGGLPLQSGQKGLGFECHGMKIPVTAAGDQGCPWQADRWRPDVAVRPCRLGVVMDLQDYRATTVGPIEARSTKGDQLEQRFRQH